MKKNILEEGVRYIIVGVLTTAINYIVYAGCDFLFERMGIPPFFSYKIAYLIAFVIAVFFAYFANKYLVFQKSGGNKGRELVFCGFSAFYAYSGLDSQFRNQSGIKLYRK